MKPDLVVIALPGQPIITSSRLRIAVERLARRGLRFTGRMVAGRFELAEIPRAA